MHCVVMCTLVYNMMCVACCVHLCVIGYIWKTRNTRARKHNLMGSENKMNMKIQKLNLNCICGWRLAPLRKKVMNR